MNLFWSYRRDGVDWEELSRFYALSLGEKSPEDLQIVFKNSRFCCFALERKLLVGAGRALADGRDCSCLCDVAVHPAYRGRGIGKKIVRNLVERSRGHRKILLYANPGKEAFYAKLGFDMLHTGMAIFFEKRQEKIQDGTLSPFSEGL